MINENEAARENPNAERAQKAEEAARAELLSALRFGGQSKLAAHETACARLHEANRFKLVVCDRVREALAP